MRLKLMMMVLVGLIPSLQASDDFIKDIELILRNFEQMTGVRPAGIVFEPTKPGDLNISNGEVGRCYFTKVNNKEYQPTIGLLQDAWDKFNFAQRELLVFHELGHCLFRKKHVEGRKHIMNPQLPESWDGVERSLE